MATVNYLLPFFKDYTDGTSFHIYVKLLIASEADLNKQDEGGNTILHIAVKNNYIDTVKLVIDTATNATVNINIQNKHGNTPLHLAAWDHNTEILGILLKWDIDGVWIQNSGGNTIFHIVAENNYTDISNMLVDFGLYGNLPNMYGNTPLHIAAMCGHVDIARAYIQVCGDKYDIDIHVKNNNGNTPLHLATQNNREAVVKLLIDAGADVDLQNNNKRTPINYTDLNKTIVSMLIAAKANVNIQDKDGNTILFNAVDTNNIDTVRMLLEVDADIDLSSNGITPLQHAIDKKYTEVARLILQHMEFEDAEIDVIMSRTA